eukprot:13772265-Alexandrium_andersonii.AAC.1
MSPNTPFLARQASDRSQVVLILQPGVAAQQIETASGAQKVQIVCRRARRVSILATPKIESHYKDPMLAHPTPS